MPACSLRETQEAEAALTQYLCENYFFSSWCSSFYAKTIPRLHMAETSVDMANQTVPAPLSGVGDTKANRRKAVAMAPVHAADFSDAGTSFRSFYSYKHT